MKYISKNRYKTGVSQRGLAHLSSVSFRTIQLLESGKHDPKLSTLIKIATSLGYPPKIIDRYLDSIFDNPIDSISIISERILEDGEGSWKIWLFNFADAFRKNRDCSYVDTPPSHLLSPKLTALLASTVETLCEELSIKIPSWCKNIPALSSPWFVAEIDNLKAISIVESPVHFRKRNIFVLGNFLSRR